MSLVKWIFIGLVVLPAAELVALVLVAALIGWLATIALFVATSGVGLLLLPLFAVAVALLRSFGQPPSLCLPYLNLLLRKTAGPARTS